MPNSLEEKLRAIHSSIAQTKRDIDLSTSVEQYDRLQVKLKLLEEERLELLNKMEVEIMSNRYSISTKKHDAIGVVDLEDEEFFVRIVSESGARVIADLLNEKEDLIKEKPLDLHKDFEKWDKLINRLNKNGRRLIEIEEEYETKSEKILNNARTIKEEAGKDIIKEKYGGNNDKTRKKYVEETLKELTDEKQELKLQKEEDNRRISFIKRLIDMKIELIKYDGETSL